MWINKEKYIGMQAEISQLENQVVELQNKVNELEDDSGEALINRLTKLAKLAKIDVHGEEYQVFMNRMFMSVAGRESPEAKAYSKTAFMKDNPEEIIDRLKDFQKQASVITRELEDKTKKGK